MGINALRLQNPRNLKFKRQPLAATCGHLQPLGWPQVAARASGRKWPQVARRSPGRIWNFQSSVACSHLHYLQPLAATLQVAASGCKWLHMMQVMLLGRQIPARMAPPVKTWKKKLFSRTAFFQVFFETWGESWNERKEITNRKEEFKRKDGRNEMDELKGKEELNEQDKRVDTKAQTQQIERKSWNGRKHWTIRTLLRVYAKERKYQMEEKNWNERKT